MGMTADLRDRLKGAGVAGAAIYRDERPQGSGLPVVRLQLISDARPSTMEGRQRLRESRVQADCMAASRGQADGIAEALITAAEPAGEAGTTQFERAFVDGTRTYSERADSGVVTFVTSVDLLVWHQPAN